MGGDVIYCRHALVRITMEDVGHSAVPNIDSS
jgi:hypothetical protein